MVDDESGEPLDLKSKSDIISAIRTEFRFKVYVDKPLNKNAEKDLITKWLNNIMTNEDEGV